MGTRVLIVTGDPIGKRLAGPAIRAWNIATQLSRSHPVRMISTSSVSRELETPFPVEHIEWGDDRGLRPHLEWADAVLFQGFSYTAFGGLRWSEKVLIADLYDPMHLEQLEQGRHLESRVWRARVDDVTAAINAQLRRADFVLCASEVQRDFWLGALGSVGRINPLTYEQDRDLRRLIDVVPFGLPDEEPQRSGPGIRGMYPGVDALSKVILWGGGLYDWFDPETLVRAVASLTSEHPEVVLFFQGTAHPNPDVPEMRIVSETRALARDLGVLGTSVILNDSWVDYDRRQDYLLDADAGVSTHRRHVETAFSFRTRILDYLWAGLPMVITEGDFFAEVVEVEGLGVVVPEGDPVALASALERVLFDDDFASEARAAVRRVRSRFHWGHVIRPLETFLAHPGRAADAGTVPAMGGPRRRPIASDLAAVRRHLAAGGPSAVMRRVRARWRDRRS